MGYDQHRQSGSWGILSCIGAVAVLLVVGLGIVALIGVGVAIWQGFGGVPQVAVVEQQAAVELHELDPRLNFEVAISREGNSSVDGKRIGLDDLKTRLAKLREETSNAFSVRINADPECPVKLLIPVLDVCKDVGDVGFTVVVAAAGATSDAASVSEAE